jgi:spore coat protein H
LIMMSKRWYLAATACIVLTLSSCYKEVEIVPGEGFEDWSYSTHGADASPDYDMVYPQDKVNRMDIVIDEDDWQTMLDDLDDLYGSSSGGPGMGGPGQFSEETPVTVECSVFMDDIEWYHVGIRFKGNSSLQSTYNNNLGKYPLRLDFDTYSDLYPSLNGQTFYGFEEISLSNNYDDPSLLREKVASDIFRDFGVPAPQTAFYRIYVDHGDGATYFGLYTMVEVVFDQMIQTQFSDGSGNCYKPDGDAASFESGSYDTDELEKKTNEDFADWSDVESLYNNLHDGSRTSNPDSWKENLESVFNVDGFLKYLAVNTVIQNWDTYGRMTHNYYLYNDPTTNQLNWIPWDNNEAFQEGKMGGSLDLSLSSSVVSDDWPLIRYLIDNEDYQNTYHQYLEEVVTTSFEPTSMATTYQTWHDMIEPYVTGTDGEQSGYSFLDSDADFTNGLQDLIDHAEERKSDVESYLD